FSDRSIYCRFESNESVLLVVNLADQLNQRHVLLRIRHLHFARPLPPRIGPLLLVARIFETVAEEKLSESVLGSNVVLLSSFAKSDQVPQSFMLLVRNPDRRKIAC